jgi:hypothetical protein
MEFYEYYETTTEDNLITESTTTNELSTTEMITTETSTISNHDETTTFGNFVTPKHDDETSTIPVESTTNVITTTDLIDITSTHLNELSTTTDVPTSTIMPRSGNNDEESTTKMETTEITTTDSQTFETSTLPNNASEDTTFSVNQRSDTEENQVTETPMILTTTPATTEGPRVWVKNGMEYHYSYEEYETDETGVEIPGTSHHVDRPESEERRKNAKVVKQKRNRDNSYEYYVDSVSASREERMKKYDYAYFI